MEEYDQSMTDLEGIGRDQIVKIVQSPDEFVSRFEECLLLTPKASP